MSIPFLNSIVFVAFSRGQVDAIKVLLGYGACVNENNGGTALMDASGG